MYFPLTAPQREIWFDQMLHPQVPLYNIGTYIEINRAMDPALFTRAVQYLAAGHDALRTRLRSGPGELPEQTWLARVEVPVPLVDLCDREDPEQAALEWMQERFVQPFALEGEPLFRYALLKLGEASYRFFNVYHHLVTDGWGISLLHQRLGQIYRALLEEGEAPLRDEWRHPSYRDFIEQDRQYAQSPRHRDDLAYWTEKYRTLPEPLFRPRSALAGRGVESSERQLLWLERSFYDRIGAFARTMGSTPFHVMLAALYVYFVRSGQRDGLTVGLPILNRGGAAAKSTVGLYINMIAARFDFGTDLDFAELLGAIGRSLKADYRRQRLPLGDLYQAIGLRTSGQDHLIDLQFNFAKHDHGSESGVFRGRSVVQTNDAKQSPLIISVWEFHAHEDVQIDFVHNLAYLDRNDVRRIQNGFVQVLEQALEAPHTELAAISLLSPADRLRLEEWNREPEPAAEPATLVALFEARAHRHPERIALSWQAQQLSYAELNRRANQVAHCLISLGVGPETLVGICLERSLDMLVGLLGILKAGGAYLPLDPDYPRERLGFMLEDSGVPVLLTHGDLLDTLPPHTATTLCLDSDRQRIAGFPDRDPAAAIGPHNLAYVIYTSGSTGKPKGCQVTHGNVTRLFTVTGPLFGFGADDVWTLFHSYAFDFSVWEIWGALLYGGRLVVVPYLTSRDPEAFYQLLIEQQVTVLNQTPSAFAQLIPRDRRPQDLALRYVVFGGEALDYAALQPWFQRHGDRRPQLVNMYGITETTVHVTHCPLAAGADLNGNIGRPLADLQVWILDAQGQPLPIGVAGEMYVGGAGVSRGYLERPQLTAARFVETELLGRPRRLYRTGDQARQLADGSLEYLGRIDRQVKLRGFRIELGEIETQIARHPAVREAVVEPFGEGDNTRLVAYLTEEPTHRTEGGLEAALRAHLARRLPDYMLPATFMVLERFPLTVNGKLDRKALPAPDGAARAGFVAPRGAAQQRVADIWCRILGVEAIGVHDDFFSIGGNSLNGIRFINELNATSGEIFHIYDLFAAPTIAGFVDGIAAHYPKLAARLEGSDPAPQAAPETQGKQVAEADLEELKRLLPSPRFEPFRASRRNPPALFVLAPPRSGTTLLRVMLGGHPDLFAPPELELLGFSGLRERAARCKARDPFWLQGTVRALMELYRCDAEQAWQMMADFEAADLDVQAFYGALQSAAKGRLLVDKTPFYSVDGAILRQAEAAFDGALYVHLKRHPLGMIHSFEKARMQRILSGHPYAASLASLADAGPATRLGELLWQHCNRNILEFLDGIPAQRRFELRFEDLTASPRHTLEGLCAFLGVPLHQAMLDPYAEKQRRMTDGVVSEGNMLGDIKFHSHRKIDARVAERWREAYKEDFLGEAAWSLAERLGYRRDLQPAAIPRLAAHRARPLSSAQQRLWFLGQLEGQSATYNIPVTLALRGELDRAALAGAFRTLIQRHESLRVCFPSVQGEAGLQDLAAYDPLLPERLPELPATLRQPWIEDWVERRVHRPFDLAAGPLLRLHLLETGPREHVLLINMHHIVSDGWSLGVLIREWSALYNAARGGQDLQLPPLPIQYSDYAAWQRDWLAQGALATQLAYWKEQLADAPQLLELPTDFPRPALMRHRGRHLKSEIGADLGQRLREIGAGQGATLFMTLLAAFDVLLCRYSRQLDLAVGTPIANRGHRDTEGLVGLFVNTLVLRSRIDPEQGFTGLLRQVRDTALAGYGHQDIPFEYLVEQINPTRSMSHAPLFQVMFMLQSPELPSLDGLAMSVVDPGYRVAKFDLTLTAAERDGALVCTWEYDTDLFRAGTVERMAGHFEVLLRGICADPERAVGRLPLLTGDELARLAADDRPIAYPAAPTVVARFEARAARSPDAVALVCGRQQLSYGELNRRANRLAHRLMSWGVGPESLVGICMERSLDMLVGLLGILKAGGAYLPLDPDQPRERLHFILEDAAVPVLLTQGALLDRLPVGDGMRVLTLDHRQRDLATQPGDNPAPRAAADHLAYVIYTSGSTGRPKGCQVTHANLARLFSATEDWFHFGEGDVWTLFHSYAFDFSVWEIWGALLYGGRLVVVPYLTSRDPEAFYRLLIDQQVTVLNQTPSAFRQLMAVDTRPERLALRQVIFGGEALDVRMLAPWFERHDPATPRLVNMYGITETTVHVTFCPIQGAEPEGGGIGVPIPDLRVRLLDPLGQPVPDGVPGEMYVSGGGVARGYLNRPQLTAERFVETDRFGARERLYRTGDLARRLPDGSLDYLGRIDNQVQLRGFRVELGEVEAVLQQHAAVREAVVLLDGEGDHQRLVAYLTEDRGQKAEDREQKMEDGLDGELRTWARQRLPDYMVPGAFVLLDAMPLTGNGKTDHRALAGLAVEAAPRRPGAILETEGQRRMAGVWAEVLQLPPERIGADDNFFDLGGHSLLATQLVSRIRTAFDLELPLRQLFEQPTVGELSRLIEPMHHGNPVAVEMEEGVL